MKDKKLRGQELEAVSGGAFPTKDDKGQGCILVPQKYDTSTLIQDLRDNGFEVTPTTVKDTEYSQLALLIKQGGRNCVTVGPSITSTDQLVCDIVNQWTDLNRPAGIPRVVLS